MSATNPNRDRWLEVVGYEVGMLNETYRMVFALAPVLYAQPLLNAITESRVLHTRNLCEFCCPRDQHKKDKDDIKPENLFDNYDAAGADSTLQGLVDDVAKAYAEDTCPVEMADGTTELHTPKWAFDKKLAHPTQKGGTSFNYEASLNLVLKKIKLVVEEILRLRSCNFPLLDQIGGQP